MYIYVCFFCYGEENAVRYKKNMKDKDGERKKRKERREGRVIRRENSQEVNTKGKNK